LPASSTSPASIPTPRRRTHTKFNRANKLSEIREQIDGCHRALVELETRAGIAEAAESLRTEPPNYFFAYDVGERHSDERREAELAEERFHQERTNRRLRDLYLKIRDFELRKELISKDREEGSLTLRYYQQELSDAAGKLETARSIRGSWWVWASIFGIVVIGLGFHFLG
jgi:hypothetical protein